MSKNIVQMVRSQLHHGACLLHAGYLRLQTHASETEYAELSALALQQWLKERTSPLRYTYIACLV